MSSYFPFKARRRYFQMPHDASRILQVFLAVLKRSAYVVWIWVRQTLRVAGAIILAYALTSYIAPLPRSLRLREKGACTGPQFQLTRTRWRCDAFFDSLQSPRCRRVSNHRGLPLAGMADTRLTRHFIVVSNWTQIQITHLRRSFCNSTISKKLTPAYATPGLACAIH